MKRRLALLVLIAGLFGSVAANLRADVTAEEVRRAIERGVNYLKSQQRGDGSWESVVAFHGGISALCTLALLNAGVEPSDPAMQRALDHLRDIKPDKTYVVALQTMVFARAEPEKDRLLIARNVKWLENAQIVRGARQGAWSYSESGGDGDNSNSQFALLALHEAERVGVSAREQTWRLAKSYWEENQNADGSWGYPTQMGSSGSMTCAGVSSLAIAADRVQATDARVVGDRIECCKGRDDKDADRIERGMQWLGRNYSVTQNPGRGRFWTLYYLYGLERAGRLTARRFISLPEKLDQPVRADWYREGSDFLVRQQDPLSGFWTGSNLENKVIGTSFALLFLSKGRWPVLIGKLRYGSEGSWNRHRGDAGNLTRYVESRWKRDLTWQVVDLQPAAVEDLEQTPVLYFCGDQSPLPDDPVQRKATAEKLRDYLDRGGFLLAEADCGSLHFDEGFRALMKLAFPEPEYQLRLLEREHPIWYAEEKVDARHLRRLEGIEYGCRTSVVYAPPDPVQDPQPSLSCLWDLSRPGRGVKYSRAVQARIDAALSLGLNVMAYATNRELKTKEDFFEAPASQRAGSPAERGRLSVATLYHPGGCNVAPRALWNLMEAAGRELKIRPKVREEPLKITDESLFDHHLVFMHGRTAFRLTDAERRRLAEYIERGGMLMADSICGSRAFAESFRREMAAAFPDRKLERIPADDKLLSTEYGGFDLRTVSRRDPAAGGEAGGRSLDAAVRKVPPDLEGIRFGDRWGGVFSQYDLSCALEKRDSLECRGYTRDDAARIGLNVVLYSLQQ